MNKLSKPLFLVFALVLVLGAIVPMVGAQDVERVCLITDIGRVNDGTFNQYAHEGAVAVTDEYDLEYDYVETIAETDYDANLDLCISGGFDVIITVGFLMEDVTREAAEANPDIYFIGIDQFVVDGPENLVGIQFREDQAGFLVGALAALVAEEEGFDTIAGVYGVDIPPVIKFRNGYEQGAKYINPDINLLGVYIDDFNAPDRGASAAEQFIGEGAGVVFGAGGPTGNGGILAAAEQGVYVIGVDQDQYFTVFGEGETPGAEYLITSAMKSVDQGVFDMVEMLVEGDMDAFPGGSNYILSVENDGINIAPKHDADIPDEIYEEVAEIREMMAEGEIETGVDPVSGELLEEEGEEEAEPDATEESDD